jgi:hypothetical protein
MGLNPSKPTLSFQCAATERGAFFLNDDMVSGDPGDGVPPPAPVSGIVFCRQPTSTCENTIFLSIRD